MQPTFTPEILVKHLYNETNTIEAKAIRAALTEDVSLEQEFAQLQEAKRALDEMGGDEPNQDSIQKILAFSKQQESIAII